MKYLYGKTIHVIGFAGSEGAALLQYLSRSYPRAAITAHDYSEKKFFLKHFLESHVSLPKAEARAKAEEILGFPNVQYQFRQDYLKGINDADTIFVPQSWFLYPQNKPLKKYQEKFRSITRLYFDLFPGKIIGITGSNGKTTTSNMIAEIMKRFYPRTIFTGNDRRTEQALESLAGGKKDDWLVLEISNRQLKIDLGKSPDISVITNITPNHLAEHGGFEEYARTKASILKYQKKNQWSVLNQDDPESRKLIEIDSGETLVYSTEEILPRGVFVEFGNIVIKHGKDLETVMPFSDLPLMGKHNLSNALAATAATYLAGVPIEMITQTLRSLEPIPQRMEPVATINGVTFYNDTAATVPQATIAAINALAKPDHALHLIMGGRSKGMEYEELANTIKTNVATLVLLNSPLAEEMKLLLSGSPANLIEVDTLQQALQAAKKEAREGDFILLSPAGEYFVYFKDKMPGYKNFRGMVTSLHPPAPASVAQVRRS